MKCLLRSKGTFNFVVVLATFIKKSAFPFANCKMASLFIYFRYLLYQFLFSHSSPFPFGGVGWATCLHQQVCHCAVLVKLRLCRLPLWLSPLTCTLHHQTSDSYYGRSSGCRLAGVGVCRRLVFNSSTALSVRPGSSQQVLAMLPASVTLSSGYSPAAT